MKYIICTRCRELSPRSAKICRHCQDRFENQSGNIMGDVTTARAQLFWSILIAITAGIVGLILTEKVLVWS